MLKSDMTGFSERFKDAQIGLKEILTVMDITLEDQPKEFAALSPYDVLEGLDDSIDRTVHGAKIERFRPRKGNQPFHTFEIHTEGGEVLGYLNMIYLRKPIPCYYLVYVEVLSPFRGRGLGQRILKAFGEFTEDKGSVGLLDNIIPPADPTYGIYTKLGWKPIEDLSGEGMVNGGGHYMVYVPVSIRAPDLREKLVKLLFRIKKKRPIIDMRDNEAMVKRTISEFRSVYEALERLFDIELSTGTSDPLMHFMFTKFVTKVLGFQRRIASLLGYTGGESLEQISISDRIKSLPIQPYSLWGSKEVQAEIWGEEKMVRTLPEELKKEPTKYIEDLPLYRRPYLSSWMDKEKEGRFLNLKIRDLLELTFDPTKLREFHHAGAEYIFERISPHFLSFIEKKRKMLPKIAEDVERMRLRDISVQINAPLAIFRDRGNVYILRKKVEGIHLDEALDQLRTSPHLKDMNRAMGIDRMAVMMINEVKSRLMRVFDSSLREEIEDLTFFISWDLQKNIPKIMVDVTGISMHTLWVA
ncbi:MAG: hypothetical protein A2156_08625 [Deltaproteobacteria bacterium RBG_16_48_10]|nr:MAG: hypothetical protein A2156_08625 [Deltaproteobacteria bacterium RBG_16_48_10]